MKQFYYGNILEENGYKILAHSNDIPENILAIMEKCAIPCSDLNAENNQQIGMMSLKEGMIFFSNHFVMPKIEKGENRPTYFTHEYFIDLYEMAMFLEYMPYIIINTIFQKDYSDYYDILEKELNINKVSLYHMNDSFLKAAESVLYSNMNMVIYGNDITEYDALKIIATIAESVDIEKRQKISFITNVDEPGESLNHIKFIFCSTTNVEKFKNKYLKECKYYDMDNQKMVNFDTTENIVLLNQNIQNDYDTTINSINKKNSKDCHKSTIEYAEYNTQYSVEQEKKYYDEKSIDINFFQKKIMRTMKNLTSIIYIILSITLVYGVVGAVCLSRLDKKYKNIIEKVNQMESKTNDYKIQIKDLNEKIKNIEKQLIQNQKINESDINIPSNTDNLNDTDKIQNNESYEQTNEIQNNENYEQINNPIN